MLRHLLIILVGSLLWMMPIDLIFAAPQDISVRDTSTVTIDSKAVPAELSTFVG